MKKTILITGANGMLAKQVSKRLSKDQYEIRFLSRNPKGDNDFHWDIEKGVIDEDAVKKVDIVVHLAGASVGEKVWSVKRKKEILDSRVKAAQLILTALENTGERIEKFISASGTSVYGIDSKDQLMDESAPKGDGFLADVVQEWEKAADAYQSVTSTIIKLRFGVILEINTGMLGKLKPIFKLGLGSAVGTGNQYIPWVHAHDATQAVLHSIVDQVPSGAYNIVSGEYLTNKAFSKAFAKSLKRPFFLPPVPSFLLKAALGEMSTMVLGGNKVSNQKALQNGFEFKYTQIEKALSEL